MTLRETLQERLATLGIQEVDAAVVTFESGETFLVASDTDPLLDSEAPVSNIGFRTSAQAGAVGPSHAACEDRLNALFSSVHIAAIVRVQNPVRIEVFSSASRPLLGFREPEPDIALVKPRDDYYSSSHPAPDDVLLIVEVADTSAGRDRREKLLLYARSGISEVWLVDLAMELIEVYARPANGRYQDLREANRGETLTLSSLPKLAISVDDILG